MTNRRFFVVVWKVNALIILAIGVLAAGALVFAGIIALRDLTRTRHATNVVNVGNDRSARTTTRLGTFTKVPGTEVFRAPLHIEQEYELSVVSKETTSVQNYLFYDSVSGRSYWLSDGTRVLFAETHELPHRRPHSSHCLRV